MKKSLVLKILIGVTIVAIIFTTILAVYTGQTFFKATEFNTVYLIEFIGSIALDLGLFIFSLFLMIRILGGKEDGKNSKIRKDK